MYIFFQLEEDFSELRSKENYTCKLESLAENVKMFSKLEFNCHKNLYDEAENLSNGKY